ncbi:flavin reductase family protein [Streptomyces sp. NPDC050439]|uniref:flavin reductase family protein n=1 Tax=unclassified Streptomyces TaxID=2593676 RepID=UPI00344341D4
MAGVCSPVTVITTLDGERPRGATVSAFASLSLDPPLISVALAEDSALLTSVRRTGRFAVNVLARSQEEEALRFARRGVNRFAGTGWSLDEGLPRLVGSAGWLACEVAQTVRGGDHVLLFGLVTHAARADELPLVYAQRRFGTHSALLPRPTPGASRWTPAESITACSR